VSKIRMPIRPFFHPGYPLIGVASTAYVFLIANIWDFIRESSGTGIRNPEISGIHLLISDRLPDYRLGHTLLRYQSS